MRRLTLASFSGVTESAIRAGDVVKDLGLKGRHPLVCSTLGGGKFEELARVKLLAIDGPKQSSTTLLRFSILP